MGCSVKSKPVSEQELWARTRRYQTIREQAEDCIKKGKLTIEVAEIIVRVTWRCDRISDIFDSIYDTLSSFFTAKDLEQDFEVLTWNEDGPTNNKPIFFQQMLLDDLKAFRFEESARLTRDSFFDPDNPIDFINGLSFQVAGVCCSCEGL